MICTWRPVPCDLYLVACTLWLFSELFRALPIAINSDLFPNDLYRFFPDLFEVVPDAL